MLHVTEKKKTMVFLVTKYMVRPSISIRKWPLLWKCEGDDNVRYLIPHNVL